jgi:hypothetical protein
MIRSRDRNRLAFGALALLLVVAVILLANAFRREPAPASPAVLERIAEKNDEAAAKDAAHLKEESEIAAEAADQELAANEAR